MTIDTSTRGIEQFSRELQSAGRAANVNGAASRLRALAAERDEWKERAIRAEEVIRDARWKT